MASYSSKKACQLFIVPSNLRHENHIVSNAIHLINIFDLITGKRENT